MKIIDFLSLPLIEPELTSENKNSVLRELVSLFGKYYPDIDSGLILKVIEERERLGSTGTASGIAIPHGKVKGLRKVLMSMGRSRKGIDFDSIDGKPAHLFFLIAAPEVSVGVHLSLLARINKISSNRDLVENLMNAPDAQEIRRLIDWADEEE